MNNSSFNGGILRNVDEQIMVNHQMIPNLLSSNNTTTTTTTSTSSMPTSSASTTTTTLKKKRNLPGTPYPDAEVIALSPKTLMATNRFICEVCNKGFQREQNLQLHRRGHNLPWKLKQKNTKEVVRRKVYLCPEPTCVHHEASRALGDLTGIKKHFSRKHGEKKWKCDKCSKRYAVQSDWKAHSKTCGTREYRCDCGTLFSRRDSFITHRAFCDALAQDSASRHTTSLNTIGNHHLYGTNSNHMSLGLSQVGIDQISPLQNPNNPSPSTHLLKLGGSLGTKFEHILSQSNPSSFYRRPQQEMPNPPFFMNDSNQQGYQLDHQGIGLSPTNNATNMFNLSFFSNNNITSSTSNNNGGNNGDTNSTNISSSTGFLNHQHDQFTSIENGGLSSMYQHHENLGPPQMSATALLQKAAQMGSTTSGNNNNSALLRGLNRSTSSLSSGTKTERQLVSPNYGRNFGNVGGGDQNENHIQGLMNSLANGTSSIFGIGHENDCAFEGYDGNEMLPGSIQNESNLLNSENANKYRQSLGVNIGESDKLTLDFLGVGGMMRNIGGGHHGSGRGYLQREQQQQQQQQQHEGDHRMLGNSFDMSMKPTQENLQFGGAKHQ